MERLTVRYGENAGFTKILNNKFSPCKNCKHNNCSDCVFQIHTNKLSEYEDLCLSVNGINNLITSHEKLELERNYWEREAKKFCSQLGEIRILMEK